MGFFNKKQASRTKGKKAFLFLIILGIAVFLAINLEIIIFSKKYSCFSDSQALHKKTIMVLGAKVFDGGTLSDMYKDRIDAAIELYESGAANQIFISGDSSRPQYDEISPAKNYLLEKAVLDEDILVDGFGVNTYNSLYRARHIFQIDNLMISTQEFHLARAIYIARKLGIDACGVQADRHFYQDPYFYQSREFLARIKAKSDIFFKAKPKFSE